ncbi:long-chain-fatty-acid--CoA ligase [Rhodococcus triatomae]
MSLTQGLHRSVQQRPDGIYSIDGDRTLTNRQVVERVGRIAGGLRALGVVAEDRVAILALNSDTYMQTVLAVAWADAIIVPVNTRWSLPEIADSLEEAGVRLLVVDDVFLELGRQLVGDLPSITLVAAGTADVTGELPSIPDMAEHGPSIPDVHRGGSSTAGLFYTGGTTGRSRGVVLTHDAISTAALGFVAAQPFDSTSVCMVTAPMFHLAQFSGWVAASLMGAPQVVQSMFDPAVVMSQIETHRISRAVLVPTMLHAVITHPEFGNYDLSSVETVVYGGSPIPQATLDFAREVLPHVGFMQVYGMTEMAAVVTVLPPEDHAELELTRSAGKAAPHVLLRVVSPDTGVEIPLGQVGEIVVRGANMMAEYWQRPNETAGVIRDGWLHTGDAGYLDERGFLFIVDRVKDMIVSGGENVYSVEVENAIAKHPAVNQCAVIGVPDEKWGERVHAVVVLKPDASLDLVDLQTHCRSSIAGYKCPRSLTVVDTLPLSAAGKILKRNLRDSITTTSPMSLTS